VKAEEVYNIAIYLPQEELERLSTFISNRLQKNVLQKTKKVKPKLITEEEAFQFVLKTVFKRNYHQKKATFANETVNFY
jgi:hypothetical protein